MYTLSSAMYTLSFHVRKAEAILLDVAIQKPATVREVARAAGVSTATVSRVFHGKAAVVSDDTAERVRSVARELRYTPSEIGRSLKRASTRIVVMIVPDSTNDFCADVSVSVERALAGIGLSMILMNSGEEPARQDQLLGDAESLRPRAVLLLGALDTAKLREACRSDQNLVFINRRPPAGITAPYVGIDNVAGGRAVADLFLQEGYRRCAVIHGPLSYSASRGRLNGFMARMAEAGVPTSDIRRIESPLTMEAGYERGRAIVADPDRPEAIFCGNDMIAYGLYRAIQEAGLTIPDDIALCGFDDNRINEWLAPWLTSVRIPALDIGPAVKELLTGASGLRNRPDIVLPFSLQRRRSA